MLSRAELKNKPVNIGTRETGGGGILTSSSY